MFKCGSGYRAEGGGNIKGYFCTYIFVSDKAIYFNGDDVGRGRSGGKIVKEELTSHGRTALWFQTLVSKTHSATKYERTRNDIDHMVVQSRWASSVTDYQANTMQWSWLVSGNGSC